LRLRGRRRRARRRAEALPAERRDRAADVPAARVRRRVGRRGARRRDPRALRAQARHHPAGAPADRARARRRRRELLPLAANRSHPPRRRGGVRAAAPRRARDRRRARPVLRPRRRGSRPRRPRPHARRVPPRRGASSLHRMSTTDLTALASRIEELYETPTADLDDDAAQTVEQVMTMLDEGEIRVAAPTDTGWQVNEWAKKAILLSFRTRGMETIEVGPYEYHDKMPLK